MTLIHFRNDYNDIAHQDILTYLQALSDRKHIGYGLDFHSERAKVFIQQYFKRKVYIHFMVGGTSTNKTVIAHLLKPYEAVISAESGHIAVHETGAIEATGHKVIIVPSVNGKLTPEDIKRVYDAHTDEHMVKPKLVYISNATETGHIYTKKELRSIYKMAQSLGLYVYLDGARLGVALTSNDNDLSFDDLMSYTDIFYIGGTKNGAMLGEALITKHQSFDENYRYSIKQQGGMLAKGFLIGCQFEMLFKDFLFFDIGRQANEMSQYLCKKLKELNLTFTPTPTNQQFLTLPNDAVTALEENYSFEVWHRYSDQTMIRLVTTYRTTTDEIDQLMMDIKQLLEKK